MLEGKEEDDACAGVVGDDEEDDAGEGGEIASFLFVKIASSSSDDENSTLSLLMLTIQARQPTIFLASQHVLSSRNSNAGSQNFNKFFSRFGRWMYAYSVEIRGKLIM